MKAAKTLVVRTEDNKAELKSYKTRRAGASPEPGVARRMRRGVSWRGGGEGAGASAVSESMLNCICLKTSFTPCQHGRHRETEGVRACE